MANPFQSRKSRLRLLVVLPLLIGLGLAIAFRPEEPGLGELPRKPSSIERNAQTAVNSTVALAKGDFQAIYKVEVGDSLFRIARRHGITVSALKDANGLTRDFVEVGQFLVIPKP